jgi:hypothetical protein
MFLFPQYRISDRHGLPHFRMTQKIGLFPIFVTLVMMFARPAGPGPGLWCVFGLAAGLEILLWGAHSLHVDTGGRLGFGQRLKAASDGWYPLFLFAIQNIFILLTVAIFWLTLQELGVPSSIWINLNVAILALLIPGYRLAREMMQRNDDVKYVLCEKACRYLIVSLLTTLAFGSWLTFILPETGTPPPDVLFRILVVGVAACLVVLTCVALLLDFWFRRRNTPG